MDASTESICLSNITETSAADDYEEVDSNEVAHIPTGLVFTRCAIGQKWENDQCVGVASLMTWQEALNTSLGFELNQSKNWRLPNIKELSVIVERSCVRPSVNTEIFHNSPIDDFWTSTPSMQNAENAWFISFANGTSSVKNKDRSLAIRMVRTRLPTE
ncbi:DUF1566 domain-containing protein [Ningiella sp. W23]|uniref:Lcl C-terminal domain-containing protein n=1 Tax=Ningiella sp. W23 TaxID=3023715 RepID=UPI003757A839